MVTEIPLTKGYVTIVDDEDAEAVLQFKWKANSFGGEYVYASRTATVDGKESNVYLHCWLMDKPPGMLVDHINRNTLDNRRCNLRVATKGQNTANARGRTGRYKGIDFQPSRNRWRARIMVDGTQKWLGRFKTEEEAARAYDAALLEAHGEFALLNFPQEA